MKRLLCLLSIACLAAPPARAQGHDIGYGLSIDGGLKAGVNLAQLRGDGWDQGYKAGFLGGLYVALNSHILGGQVEGLFMQSQYVTMENASQLPSTFFNQLADSAKSGTYRVSSFAIPVLLNVKLFGKAVLQLGPQYSGILSVQDEDKLLKDAEGLFKSGTVSGVVGLWLRLGRHFNMGGRYVFGISDAQNKDAFQTYQQYRQDWKARDIQLHLGFSF